jgi:hypothetical protein
MNRAHTARVITVQRIGKLCAMDCSQRDQKWALSVRTCIRACAMVVQSDTMVAAMHRMLQCAAMASNAAGSKKGFWSEYGLDASPDALVLSILSPGGKIASGRRQGSVLERGRNFISTSGGSV